MLYSSLMSVAGRAGEVQIAFSLKADMDAEGIRPCEVLRCPLPFSPLYFVAKCAGLKLSSVCVSFASCCFVNGQLMVHFYRLRLTAIKFINFRQTLHSCSSFVLLVLMLTLILTLTQTQLGAFIVQATQSALINVCVCNEKLVLARQVYGETRAMGLRPHLHAFNSLINAYACNFRLGDVVSHSRCKP